MGNELLRAVVGCVVLDTQIKTMRRAPTGDDYNAVMSMLLSGATRQASLPVASTWKEIERRRPVWDAERDENLRVLVRAKYSMPVIAYIMEESQLGVIKRCQGLGLETTFVVTPS